MERYYEETALIEFVKRHTPHINGETDMECVERAIREAPTADVVPKSEVENLKVLLEMNEKAYESLKELYHTDTDALVEARRKTEVEVAREIFEEIDALFMEHFKSNCNQRRDFDFEKIMKQSSRFTINELWHDMSKLKKKYTESE